jgi:cysteine-rich repeat protein
LLAPVHVQQVPGRAAFTGIERVQPLALSQQALATLRTRTEAVIEDFPLGQDGAVDLELTRFTPFTPGARAEIVEAGGTRTLALPDHAYFIGRVLGEPSSRVLVIAAPDSVRGFVAINTEVYPFGPDEGGLHRGYALRDVDTGVHPPPGSFCANDLAPEALQVPPPRAAGTRGHAADAATDGGAEVAAGSTLLQADVAIETDQELLAKFDDEEDALDYLAALAAAGSAIYENDVGVRLRFSYIRLWDHTDPWTTSSTVDALYEVQNWWNTPTNGFSTMDRDLTHFISGKTVSGGVAYLGVLCNPYWAYGVSQVFGSFNLSSPSQIWDVVVLTHEIGHNFGSPHSHCYDPPVDRCYNNEGGCYSGPIVVTRGTIMSYCHLSGGLSNIDLEFGNQVSNLIESEVAFVNGQADCLQVVQSGPVCGNGIVDGDETCDDGNTADGDCCSATCEPEDAGSPCADDGNECTDEACDGEGECAHTNNESACDDGDSCTEDDVCSNGECTGTVFASCGPCLTCTPEGACVVPSSTACEPALAKKSQLTTKDDEEDKRDALTWTWTAKNAIAKALFGAPDAESDLTICLYDQTGGVPTLLLAATAPAGGECGDKPCWKETKTGFTYTDKGQTPDGLVSLKMRAGLSGRAKIALRGKGGNLGLPPQALVPPVTVRLERADQANACWVATYEVPSRNEDGRFRAKQQ